MQGDDATLKDRKKEIAGLKKQRIDLDQKAKKRQAEAAKSVRRRHCTAHSTYSCYTSLFTRNISRLTMSRPSASRTLSRQRQLSSQLRAMLVAIMCFEQLIQRHGYKYVPTSAV